jgi:outer membrane protein assembly factor BamE
VRFVLGSPLVVDTFRADRWDYVYLYKPGDGEREQRVISVFFDGDLLDHVEGDVQAGDAAAQAAGDQSARSRVVEIPPAAAD